MAQSIMIQGTASSVGKSLITAGLCRVFYRQGLKTAPFKSQNMALNSFVTKEGLEIGRAQAEQAIAACIEPDVLMNPILLKPSSQQKSQVIIMGKPLNHMDFSDYITRKDAMRAIIETAYHKLLAIYDLIVIEGAGSPAEINLRDSELVNMSIARMTQSPVLLVGDIDKGGVFASLVGTLELLDQSERDMIKGFIINKFRGDIELLKPGLTMLEDKTGKPVLGVLPMINGLNLPEEDSVPLQYRKSPQPSDIRSKIVIAVIDLPHLSNSTDFDPFLDEPDVLIFITRKPSDLEFADIIILPGSKNVMDDLMVLKKEGFEDALTRCAAVNKEIVGICGGYQMLGEAILDPEAIESSLTKISGLHLLDITTTFFQTKTLAQTEAVISQTGIKVKGYEIHHGETLSHEIPLFKENFQLGSVSSSGYIWGSYLHGLFENDGFRSSFLNNARLKKGLNIQSAQKPYSKTSSYDKLADIMIKNLDMTRITTIIHNGLHGNIAKPM